MDGWMDGWMDGRVGGQTEKNGDGFTVEQTSLVKISVDISDSDRRGGDFQEDE
jgi:hypothetical protein